MSKSRPDDRGVEAPQSRSKTAVKRQHARGAPASELRRFLSDFKSGLGRLKTLTQKLVERRERVRSVPAAARRVEHTLQRDILHTLERELKLVERTAPPEIRSQVVREFRTKAESAVAMGLPQTYAKLISAAEAQPASLPAPPAPAKALRPTQSPAVKALMSAVTAIRNGRLAFLPRETRLEARKLLRRIFSSGRAGRTPSAPQIAKIVQQQRLIPNIVQGMMRGYERPERYEPHIKALEQAKSSYLLPEAASGQSPGHPDAGGHTTPRSSVAAPHSATTAARAGGAARPAPVPLTARDIPRLAKAIPSFQTTGVAHAYMYEPDENVHVINKNDSLVTGAEPTSVSPPQSQLGAAPRQESAKIPSRSASTTASAPVSHSSNAASGMSKSAQTLGATDKPLVASGTLRIDGLPQFIANTEMRLAGLESRARRQDG